MIQGTKDDSAGDCGEEMQRVELTRISTPTGGRPCYAGTVADKAILRVSAPSAAARTRETTNPRHQEPGARG